MRYTNSLRVYDDSVHYSSNSRPEKPPQLPAEEMQHTRSRYGTSIELVQTIDEVDYEETKQLISFRADS